MRSSALFIIFCLFVASYATSDFADMEMIQKSEFGSTLMSTIQLSLENQEPVQNLLGMLTGMAKQLAQDQANDDQKHRTYQQRCNADIQQYNTDIANAKQRIEQLKKEIAQLKPEKQRKEDELKAQRSKLVQLQQNLAAALKQRANEAAEFKLKVEEHEKSVLAVGQAKQKFQTLLSSKQSFLEVNNKAIFTEVSSSLKSAIMDINDNGYKAILNVLVAITDKAPVQADQNIVKKILALCQKIIENINRSAELERQAEDKRIGAFNKLKSQLENDIIGTQTSIRNLETVIHALTVQINTDIKSLKDTRQTLKLKQKELAGRTKECNDETSAYNATLKKRTEERSTVEQVITIVSTKLTKFRQYLRERTQNVQMF